MRFICYYSIPFCAYIMHLLISLEKCFKLLYYILYRTCPSKYFSRGNREKKLLKIDFQIRTNGVFQSDFLIVRIHEKKRPRGLFGKRYFFFLFWHWHDVGFNSQMRTSYRTTKNTKKKKTAFKKYIIIIILTNHLFELVWKIFCISDKSFAKKNTFASIYFRQTNVEKKLIFSSLG